LRLFHQPPWHFSDEGADTYSLPTIWSAAGIVTQDMSQEDTEFVVAAVNAYDGKRPEHVCDEGDFDCVEYNDQEYIVAVGKALHRAKTIGGPWGAPCSRVKSSVVGMPTSKDDFEPVEYGFDDGSGEFQCECPQMAKHLVELITDELS